MKSFAIFALLMLFTIGGDGAALAKPKQICIYQDSRGSLKQVNSLRAVPSKYKKQARCFDPARQADRLAAPEEIDLGRSIREERSSTSLGPVDLRWARKAERLFGRTPQRATAEAMRAASRALKKSGFPSGLRTLHMDWKIVFMDEEVPEQQIPSYLVSNCHPAWMTPPANIYVVAQRVVAGCGGSRSVSTTVADSELMQTLLHEIGHVIEYQLLEGAGGRDRMRAEGFASWFEQYSSEFSPVVKSGASQQRYYSYARQSYAHYSGPLVFRGSALDYARASMYFNAVVERRRVRGLMEVYDLIRNENLSFFAAVEQRHRWDMPKLEGEVQRLLQK